jgi:hypothetical protein
LPALSRAPLPDIFSALFFYRQAQENAIAVFKTPRLKASLGRRFLLHHTAEPV